jgi:hypothetical protein
LNQVRGDIMHSAGVVNGEGASAPGFRPRIARIPVAVVGTMLGSAASWTPDAIQEVYRLAEEWARAALATSSYERVQHASWN